MPDTPQDPFVAYVLAFQKKEQAIQHALENSKIVIDGATYTLEDAILSLTQAYGTATPEARARTQVSLNTHAMLQHFKEITFATTEQRNEILKRAAATATKDEASEKERQWEAEVLAKARAEREA